MSAVGAYGRDARINGPVQKVSIIFLHFSSSFSSFSSFSLFIFLLSYLETRERAADSHSMLFYGLPFTPKPHTHESFKHLFTVDACCLLFVFSVFSSSRVCCVLLGACLYVCHSHWKKSTTQRNHQQTRQHTSGGVVIEAAQTAQPLPRRGPGPRLPS